MIEIDKLDKPEGVLTWFGDTILQLYREAREKEKPSVVLNSVSRAVDSWGRLYSGSVKDERINELDSKLNEILRDIGKSKLEVVDK